MSTHQNTENSKIPQLETELIRLIMNRPEIRGRLGLQRKGTLLVFQFEALQCDKTDEALEKFGKYLNDKYPNMQFFVRIKCLSGLLARYEYQFEEIEYGYRL